MNDIVNSQYVNPALADARERKIEGLIEESAFAKVVSTARGAGILIGGEMIEIASSNSPLHAEAIARALRQGGALNPHEGQTGNLCCSCTWCRSRR